MAFAFGLSAEIERNLISERTKESLHRLKSSGKRLGRPRGSGKAMRRLHSQRERIKALLERGETKREVARIACVSEATLYRFLRVYGVGDGMGEGVGYFKFGEDFSGLARRAFVGWHKISFRCSNS